VTPPTLTRASLASFRIFTGTSHSWIQVSAVLHPPSSYLILLLTTLDEDTKGGFLEALYKFSAVNSATMGLRNNILLP
jgi:hypothetical protein